MGRKFGKNITLYDRVYFELLRSSTTDYRQFKRLNIGNFEVNDLYAGFLNDKTYFVGIRVNESKKVDVDNALKEIEKYFNLKTLSQKGRQGTYLGKVFLPEELVEEKFSETEKRMGRVCT